MINNVRKKEFSFPNTVKPALLKKYIRYLSFGSLHKPLVFCMSIASPLITPIMKVVCTKEDEIYTV